MRDQSEARPANLGELREWLAKLRTANQPVARGEKRSPSASIGGPPAASPVTLVVARSGPADFDNLTQAVRQAPPGSRLLVRPGRYEESIVLDKFLEIAGDGPRQEIVIENPDLHCVSMLTSQATIRGLTLRSLGAAKGYKRSAADIPQGQLV